MQLVALGTRSIFFVVAFFGGVQGVKKKRSGHHFEKCITYFAPHCVDETERFSPNSLGIFSDCICTLGVREQSWRDFEMYLVSYTSVWGVCMSMF